MKDTQHQQTNDPFDRLLMRQRKARGARQTGDGFLYERCAKDAAQRVTIVNRRFDTVLVFGDPIFREQVLKIAGDKIGHVVCVNHSNAAQLFDLVCSETNLPFAAGSFDLVISGLSLHGVNHVPRALSEIYRVLRPDGFFIGCLFGGQSLTELRTALYRVEEGLTGRVTPRVAPMISMDQAVHLLQQCGYAMPVIDRDQVVARYGALKNLIEDLRRMGETNALSGRDKGALSRKFFVALEEDLKNEHPDQNGKFPISYDILWLSGWAACPSQPKPLKPGSATVKLADALGVPEHKIL